MNVHDFKVVAVKAIKPDTQNEEVLEKVRAIQKALYGNNEWLYLYKGYDIKEDEGIIIVEKLMMDPVPLYGDGKMWVNISAVVGKNGAGKSSLVDLLIRVINNLSTAIIGEGYAYNSAEHLHFIDYLYAALVVQIDERFIEVLCEDRDITVRYYVREQRHRNRFSRNGTEDTVVMDDSDNRQVAIQPARRNLHVLQELFYSLICSYSIYGFNYRDYVKERTNNDRLQHIIGKKLDKIAEQDRYWLTGLFHKNDGYQTPVVIHPMREDGLLNISKENNLGKERQLTLLYFKDEKGGFPFQIINDDMRIKRLHLTRKNEDSYDQAHTAKKLKFEGTNLDKNFYILTDEIKKFWKEKYTGMEMWGDGTQAEMEQLLWGYIVYKTMKIALSYKKYSKLERVMRLSGHTYDDISERLDEIYNDHSHVTLKLRRAINMLRFNLYYYDEYPADLDVDVLYRSLSGYLSEEKADLVKIIDLMPPPVFNFDFLMKKDGGTDDWIPFTGLSSGERQIAYTLSNFMYHMVNIDSSWDDMTYDNEHRDVLQYQYVNVMFDEVELYYHPDLQRRFVWLLTNALKSAGLQRILGVNIIIVTHSPFVLSDIPQSNILVLGENEDMEETFGANILDLFRKSFIMQSTVGEYARQELSRIFKLLGDEKAISKLDEGERKRIKYIKDIVGDPYLKRLVSNVVSDIEKGEN
jgi:hypothetical protein